MKHGEPLAWGLAVTILTHASLALAIVLGHARSVPPHPVPEVMVAKLVKLGKPRPKKLLPRKPTMRPPAPRPAPKIDPDPEPEKVEPKKPPEPKPPRPEEPKPSAVRDAMARARALAEAADEDEEPEGLPEGSPEGTAKTAAEGNPYATEVHRRIKSVWRVPDLVPVDELSHLGATVLLHLADDGRITEHRIIASSGNRFFDASVLEAVQNTSRLPPPPPSLSTIVLNSGIALEFLGSEAQ